MAPGRNATSLGVHGTAGLFSNRRSLEGQAGVRVYGLPQGSALQDVKRGFQEKDDYKGVGVCSAPEILLPYSSKHE